MERKISTSVSLEIPIIEIIDDYANGERISRSEVIRIAINEFIQNKNLDK